MIPYDGFPIHNELYTTLPSYVLQCYACGLRVVELLGRVTVLLDEVRRMQAGRQILPLVGRARGRTATSGSITVEVIIPTSRPQFHDIIISLP